MSSFDAGDGVRIQLNRAADNGGPPVLLVHGGSSSREMFRFPRPALDGTTRCLVDWLIEWGYEPWLLDWRGSGIVVKTAENNGTLRPNLERYIFDFGAQYDVPAALAKIRAARGLDVPISAVGHCLGAGVLAHAIAEGYAGSKLGLKYVVLVTLALFNEPPFASRLKSQDRALERQYLDPNRVPLIHPGRDWPKELNTLFENWAPRLRPHLQRVDEKTKEKKPLSKEERFCNRLSFMYGTPWVEGNLPPELHSATWTLGFGDGRFEPVARDVLVGSASGARAVMIEGRLDAGRWRDGDARGVLCACHQSGQFRAGERLLQEDAGRLRPVATCLRAERREAEITKQFGGIPLPMYLQAAANARRRWAAPFGSKFDYTDAKLLSEDSRKCFHELRGVTLITGGVNQVWHRDSIDRMYEWLLRGKKRDPKKHRKVVLERYGHQDLFWGQRAHEDVFPRIAEGLWEPADRPQLADERRRRSAPPARANRVLAPGPSD